MLEYYLRGFLFHKLSGSFRWRMSIIKLSLLIPLTNRMIEFSVLLTPVFRATPPVDAVITPPTGFGVEVGTLKLTTLTSLLIVLLEAKMRNTVEINKKHFRYLIFSKLNDFKDHFLPERLLRDRKLFELLRALKISFRYCEKVGEDKNNGRYF